jgi:hypothetical protein
MAAVVLQQANQPIVEATAFEDGDERLTAARNRCIYEWELQESIPEAIAYLRELIRLEPKFPVHLMLGVLLESTGDITGAREVWTEGVRADPITGFFCRAMLSKLPEIAPPPREKTVRKTQFWHRGLVHVGDQLASVTLQCTLVSRSLPGRVGDDRLSAFDDPLKFG